MPGLAVQQKQDSPDEFQTGKAYTVAQAARLAGTTPATVRRWLYGYSAPGHRMDPVFGSRQRAKGEGTVLLVSFLQLVEIAVVARYRRGAAGAKPIPLERLRRAHEYAQRVFGLPYPFASLRLRQVGPNVMHEFDVHNPGGPLLALNMGGQWALPEPVQLELDQLDFDTDQEEGRRWPVRWFPKGRDVPVVIDPYIAAGQPVILGRGVRVETIIRRQNEGESLRDIAREYELKVAVIRKALASYAA